MVRHSRLKVFNTIIREGVMPIFYHPEIEVVIGVIRACLDGGASCFEFTNRGDGAYDVFRHVTEHFRNENCLILGAGTIMDPATAALFIQAGADFIVGPTLNPEVAKLCNRRKVAYIPGCGNTNDISLAEELGMEICKIFPGSSLGGPGFVKSVLGPMPWSRLLPTGGVEVSEENVSAWIKAGAAGVGIGSHLFRKDIIENKNFQQISNDVKNMLDWIASARGSKDPVN